MGSGFWHFQMPAFQSDCSTITLLSLFKPLICDYYAAIWDGMTLENSKESATRADLIGSQKHGTSRRSNLF